MARDMMNEIGLSAGEAQPRRGRRGVTGPNTREFCCGLAVITVLGMVASMRGGPNEGMAASQNDAQVPARPAYTRSANPQPTSLMNDPLRSSRAPASAQEKTRSE